MNLNKNLKFTKRWLGWEGVTVGTAWATPETWGDRKEVVGCHGDWRVRTLGPLLCLPTVSSFCLLSLSFSVSTHPQFPLFSSLSWGPQIATSTPESASVLSCKALHHLQGLANPIPEEELVGLEPLRIGSAPRSRDRPLVPLSQALTVGHRWVTCHMGLQAVGRAAMVNRSTFNVEKRISVSHLRQPHSLCETKPGERVERQGPRLIWAQR